MQNTALELKNWRRRWEQQLRWLELVGFNIPLDTTGHLRDEPIQAIDCTGNDNQTTKNKNNTHLIQVTWLVVTTVRSASFGLVLHARHVIGWRFVTSCSGRLWFCQTQFKQIYEKCLKYSKQCIITSNHELIINFNRLLVSLKTFTGKQCIKSDTIIELVNNCVQYKLVRISIKQHAN